MYREHSADRQRRKPDEELSEEEYLARRREEKLKKIQEKEEKAQARMNKKARGITSATTLPKETAAEPDNPIDIHEIVVVHSGKMNTVEIFTVRSSSRNRHMIMSWRAF